MSYWGMGITQNDEYCEVYELFMEEYDKGKPVAEITNDILIEYESEFSANDGILHDVYFALGKAEWMCGGVSEIVIQQITKIIESGDNISFLKQFGATESDLKARKKNLNKFLKTLSVPRGKTRNRKIPEEKYINEPKIEYTPLPYFKDGDVLAYNDKGIYRIFSIVRHQKAYSKPVVFCYLWKKQFTYIPTTEELFNEYIMPLGYLDGNTFPNTDKIIFIGNISYLQKLGAISSPITIKKEWFRPVFILRSPDTPPSEYNLDLCLTLNDVIDKIGKLLN